MKLEQLAEKKVVIFSHYATTGAPDELRDWLLKIKVKELVYVAFPFGSNKDSFIRVELYKRGELQGTHRSWFRWKMREPLNHVKDLLYAMYYAVHYARGAEVLAAGDNLLTMACVLTRWVTKIRCLVYFMLDYTPVRFRNRFLNETYYAVDRFSAYHADAVWPGASEVVTGRAKAGRLDERRVNWYAVPYGSHPQKECEQTESGRKRIVYLGDVVRNKGAELFVPMACELKKLVPDFRFTVIGGGKDLPALREEVRAAGLDDHFEICGFVDKIEDVVARLSGAGVAIAPYY
ncbi:MAG: glycosyltransferase, partial [Kiritimatiellae bacterium]|nr:glycosyltransferase [Kiritimatiellia bacterium]